MDLSGVFVSNGLILLPTNLADDVASSGQDIGLSDDHPNDAHLIGDVDTETEAVSVVDTNEIPSDLGPRTKSKAAANFGLIVSGIIKPLIVIVTAQYVIVTALTALVAITVVQHASNVINEKFAAITMALKRF
jgi:hypothetical protein